MKCLEEAEELVRNHPANKEQLKLHCGECDNASVPHLEHYLRVLGESRYWNEYSLCLDVDGTCILTGDDHLPTFRFNLTTGKPATKKDAEEFIKLTKNQP